MERQYDEKGNSQRGLRGLYLGRNIFLSDRLLDAHRRLKGPSDCRINGEKASGFKDMLPGAAGLDWELLISLVNYILGKWIFTFFAGVLLFLAPILLSLNILFYYFKQLF